MSSKGDVLRFILIVAAFAVTACDGEAVRLKSGSGLDEARAAIVARNFGEASELASEAVRSDPDNPATHYELARASALQGNEGQALSELGLAIDKGLADAPRALADPAFDNLRDSRSFAALEERASPRREPVSEPARKADADEPEREPAVEISSTDGRETIRAGDVVINDDF